MSVVKKIKTIFQFRRSTTEEWNINKDIVPAAGEPCYDLDLKTLRVGDGTTTYENLPVIGSGTIGDAGELQVEIDALKSTIENIQINITNVETNVSELQTQVGDTNVVEVQSNVAQLTENMTNLTTQVEANNDEIVQVKQTLETKVDTEAVEAAKEELRTYVDEQIQNIESGNIDDGEI